VVDTGGHEDEGGDRRSTRDLAARARSMTATPDLDASASTGPAPWVEVARGSAPEVRDAPLARRPVYLKVLALTALVVLAVAALGAVAGRQVAEREAVKDAARQAAVLADAVVTPALGDGVLTADPGALQRLAAAVQGHVLDDSIVRVKFWTADGRIIYSDESRLVNRVFPLGAGERAAFLVPAGTKNPPIEAEVSEVDAPENTFEAGDGKLLEVYRPVWTPDGHPLLFEIYASYSAVDARTFALWRGFGAITLASLLTLVVLLLPVLWRVLNRLGRAQAQREVALVQAVEASALERRRIAGTLHDGVVQELAATSFVVAGAALHAEREGQVALTETLRRASESVRTSIGGLRSLLVDIYPPGLDQTGLVGGLATLVGGPRNRDVEVRLTLPSEPVRLRQADERLVYRIAQECLRNATRHAQAQHVDVSLTVEEDNVVLEVADDGVGFDPDAALSAPAHGHLGIRLMAHSVEQGSGRLRLRSAPGAGCLWELRVPRA
jgi:signal transduction histidine kinase